MSYIGVGVFVFCRHRGGEINDQKLFQGSLQEKRFIKILHKVMKDLPGNCDLGATISKLGTHSN